MEDLTWVNDFWVDGTTGEILGEVTTVENKEKGGPSIYLAVYRGQGYGCFIGREWALRRVEETHTKMALGLGQIGNWNLMAQKTGRG